MNETKFFEILSKKINYLIIDNIILSGGTFDIKIEKSIYSDKDTKRLYFNEKLIKLHNTKINYNCNICNEDNTILLKRFLSKKSLVCRKCKELDFNKRKNQSEYIKNSFLKYNIVKPKKNKVKKIKENYIGSSNKSFQNEIIEFKNNYYNNHITKNEFDLLKHKIFKVNNYIYNDDFVFYEHLKTNNQLKYSSYLHDIKNNIFINFNNIDFVCDNCDVIFHTTRTAKEKIKNHKILCKTCYLSNKTFKIRHKLNVNGDKITYQSQPELKLINYCNKNKIIILNGNIVKYFFDGKERTYNIDFYIPSKNYLIEIKDNHIWHKKQILSGKWKIKEKVAKKYAKQNNLTYKLIFTQYLNEFLNTF